MTQMWTTLPPSTHLFVISLRPRVFNSPFPWRWLPCNRMLASQSSTKPAALHSTLVTYSSYIASLLLLSCLFFFSPTVQSLQPARTLIGSHRSRQATSLYSLPFPLTTLLNWSLYGMRKLSVGASLSLSDSISKSPMQGPKIPLIMKRSKSQPTKCHSPCTDSR